MKDYYETLGLKKNASETEINNAYQQLINVDTNNLMKEAYEVLSNPDKKYFYDLKIYNHTLCIIHHYAMQVFLCHASAQVNSFDISKELLAQTLDQLSADISKEDFEAVISAVGCRFYTLLARQDLKNLVEKHLQYYLTESEKELAIQLNLYPHIVEILDHKIGKNSGWSYDERRRIKNFYVKEQESQDLFHRLEEGNLAIIEESEKRFDALFDKNKPLMEHARLTKEDFNNVLRWPGWSKSFYWQMAETGLLDLAQWHSNESYPLNPREVFQAYLKRVVLDKISEKDASIDITVPILDFLLNLAAMMVENEIPMIVTSNYNDSAITFFGDRWQGTDKKQLKQLIYLRSFIEDIIFCFNGKWTFISPFFVGKLQSIGNVELSAIKALFADKEPDEAEIASLEKFANDLFEACESPCRPIKSELNLNVYSP